MAPIFVGSNSDDTRIRSNRVGLSASTSDPGTASEGDIYYDSTNNQVKTYDGSSWSAIQGSGTVSGIASGTLANGQTVIIHSDGKIGGVSTTGFAHTTGTSTVFESAAVTFFNSSAYDSSNNKVVIVYEDDGNLDYGTAVVGTVTGTAVTFGTPVVFKSGAVQHISAVYDSANGKILIAYADSGASYAGKAVIGTVSGDTISFGTPVQFESGNTQRISTTYDSTNQKVVIAYKDTGNSSYGTAVVATVSGTDISYGTPRVFSPSSATNFTSLVYDSANDRVVILYEDDGNLDYGTAIVATVNETNILFGDPVIFEHSNMQYIASAYDSVNGKVVVAYENPGNSQYGTAIVGTVIGTGITFGAPVIFNDGATEDISMIYDSANEKIVIAYQDQGNSNYGTVIEGTVTGTGITFGAPLIFNDAQTEYTTLAYDSTNEKSVIAYEDVGNSQYGTAIVYQSSRVTTSLTTENFIGFSDAAYSDSDTANVQIISSVDDAQSGLTTGSKLYVQKDGSIGIRTDNNPSVFAGTAISDTEILIKQ